jgi:threonine-phosphate decarboxylase
MDFCEEGSAKALAVENPRMLILRSLTKFYALPGLRLGWAIGAPATISRLAALREPWSVNSIAQAAGIASLSDRKYAQKTREQVAYWRKELADGVADLRGCTVFPSAVNYLLVKLPTAKAGEVTAALAEQKILVRNCENFTGLDGRYLRLAVRRGEDNHRLLEALRGAVG